MISIVIPNFNGLEHLKTCYESLKKQTCKEFSLVLVDNGSKDDSVKYTREAFGNAALIQLGLNKGFAGAVNEGIKHSIEKIRSDYILLLNNDIELSPDFIENGLNAFERNPDASIVAVKMMNYYRRELIDDCGDFLKGKGGSPYARGFGETDKGQYDKPEYIFGACAGAAFYKTSLFQLVGLFDEKFFAYIEDVDFSFRCQLMDFKCYYDPLIVCYHKRGGTSSIATHGFQTEMSERNLVLMRFRNYPIMMYILYQPLFFAARVRRYYRFTRDFSLSLFLRALRGYLRGLAIVWSEAPERRRIQKSKKVSVKYIKSLFVK